MTIFSRNGRHLARRFRSIRDSLLALPARSAIVDAEIVMCDSDGKPDFNALMSKGTGALCAWCFDLLELNGEDLRERPLIERKAKLRDLLIEADDHVLRYSDEFADPVKLLDVADKAGLEGIVSKINSQPYRSGKNPGWVKVTTAAWREGNRGRWEMFQSRI